MSEPLTSPEITSWPLCFSERIVAKLDQSHIAKGGYAYPPRTRERYTDDGWKKMQDAKIDVRDYGAIGHE